MSLVPAPRPATPLPDAAERLEFVTVRAGVGYWHWSLPDDRLEWSPLCRQLFGIGPDEAISYARFLAAVHPDDRERTHAAVRACLDGDGDYDVECRALWPDGTVHWIHAKGSATYEAGRPLRMAGIALDIGARKAAEARVAEDLEFMARLQALGALSGRDADLRALMDRIIQTAIEVTRAEAGHIRLVDPVSGQLEIAAQRNLPADWLAHWDGPGRGGGATGHAFARRQRVVVEDIEHSELFPSEADRAVQRRAGIRAVQATPLTTRDGRVIGMLSTHWRAVNALDPVMAQRLDLLAREAADVIADAQAQQVRAASERAFQLLADAAPALLWITDRAGRTRYVSPRWCEYTGLPAEAALGEGWVQCVHPDDRSTAARIARAAAARHEAFELDYRMRRSDGQYRWVIDAGRPRFDAGGAFEGYVGAVIDVHARREAEREQRASEERFRAFMSHGPIAGWIVDREHRFRYVSPGYFRMFGVSGELEGRTIRDVYGAELADEYERNDAQALAADAPQESVESGLRADGSPGRFLTVKFPLHLASGETVLGGAALDITDRERAEEALRAADRQKNAFLATLSHELRNPLAPLRTAARLLAEPRLDAERLAWTRSVITRQVEHMALLLDDLLDASRVTQGKLELRRERVGLRAVIDSALETVRPLLDRKNHRLTLNLPAGGISLDADPLRLAQVLSNLLTNAAKYTEPNGRIELRASVTGSTAVIAVADDGLGLAPEAIGTLFQMFAQVENTRVHSDGGLGIGLALARGIVELHGGTIEVHSAGLGQGSTFTLRLPGAVAAEVTPGALDPPPDAAGVRGRRVLVADDNRDAADMLATVLALDGHAVRVAYGGHEALAVAQTFRPEVALLDIGMPDLDGHAVARALRSEPWASGLVIAAMTGWGQQADRERSRAAGFDHHYAKPVDPAAIEQLLR